MRKVAGLLSDQKKANFFVPLVCILFTLLVSSVILLVLGKNPFEAFYGFLAGNGFAIKQNYGSGTGMISDFFDFLNIMSPMLLAALSFIVSLRCGLFNIGISGQMLLSGFLATVTVGYMPEVSGPVAKILVLVIAIVAGGLLGAFIGFLKVRFNIHEVVSTIMVNYIISYVTGFFINAYYVDPITRASRAINPAARLSIMRVPLMGFYCNIPLGLLVALAAAFIMHFILQRTTFGFELTAVGLNPRASRYSGMKVNRRILYSLMISGALAGLAGVTYFMGFTNQIIPKELPGMGYDAIATALLGNSSPIGAIFASVIITIFQNGSSYMSSLVGVSKEIASLMVGILLLFAGLGGYYREKAKDYLRLTATQKDKQEKEA